MIQPKNMLIVDDDPKIAELIGIYLKNEGYQTFHAYDGVQALSLLEKGQIDLIILDVMMPKMDGLEVCRQIRRSSNLPILMVSAKTEDMDKIIGIMTGADDYMIKPFNPLELTVRVKALLRRAGMGQSDTQQGEEVIYIGSLEINKSTHSVQVDGNNIKLTSIEFDILFLLASHKGRVFSSEEIFESIWQQDGSGANKTVMVHISNLRDKLEAAAAGNQIIHTVWGVGYKIEK